MRLAGAGASRSAGSLSNPGAAERLLDSTTKWRDRRVNGRRGHGMGNRVIVTTGLATVYLAGCLAALSLVVGIWSSAL